MNGVIESPHALLPGPYSTPLKPDALAPTPAVLGLVAGQVRALLDSSPAAAELAPERRRRLEDDLVKIAAYSAELYRTEFALSEQLGQTPMLYHQPETEPLAGAAALLDDAPPPPPPETFSPRAADQVARITESTLNAIAFPTFVADLIQGTFRAIVDATIQQMEAFGELLANVAKTVAQFESDNITDNQARDYIADTYPGHFRVDTSGGAPRLALREGAGDRSAPNFRGDLELPNDVPVDEDVAEDTLVPAARRKLARGRHQLLSTMVLMGINRIKVTSGRIRAQMGFRISAHDTASASTASEFDARHDSIAAGWFGAGGSAHRTSVAYVSTSRRDGSDDLDVNASLTGEVDLKFINETFPLERFANTGAIMDIQQATANPGANTPVTGASRDAAPAGA